MKILRIALLITLILSSLLVWTLPVMAIDSPDTTPSLSYIRANTYLIEEDDVLIYGDYYLPYADLPEVTASEAFFFILLDGDEIIGTITPFVMMDSGYNKGVFSFYFSASDNLTWGEAYIIRIAENPTHFDSPTNTDFTMASTAYTSATDQDINQTQLAINIISAAERLESYYEDYTFLDASVGGTVLSSPTGETYFRGAIYGLQAMAPGLFLVQTLDLYTTERDWDTAQFDEYGARLDATWVGATENATATQFGITPGMVLGMLFVLPLCAGSIIVSSLKFRRAEPGFVVSCLFVIMGALMGWVPAAIFATIYQCMAIYLAYVWFYARG